MTLLGLQAPKNKQDRISVSKAQTPFQSSRRWMFRIEMPNVASISDHLNLPFGQFLFFDQVTCICLRHCNVSVDKVPSEPVHKETGFQPMPPLFAHVRRFDGHRNSREFADWRSK